MVKAEMNDYPMTIEEIVAWLRSKEHALAGSGVNLMEVRERREYVPAAVADFDLATAIGRICAWHPVSLTSRCFGLRMGRMLSFDTNGSRASNRQFLKTPFLNFFDIYQTQSESAKLESHG
jgi:hypothetical protein